MTLVFNVPEGSALHLAMPGGLYAPSCKDGVARKGNTTAISGRKIHTRTLATTLEGQRSILAFCLPYVFLQKSNSNPIGNR